MNQTTRTVHSLYRSSFISFCFMADSGWSVWEIEMTGGPFTDCEDCPDYTYEDLVDYHWPASIAGVMAYADVDKVDYVGHSNGGRAALSSLNEYSLTGKPDAGKYFNYDTGEYEYADLPVEPVGTFVAVAAPGALNGGSTFVDTARLNLVPFVGPAMGDVVLERLNKTHVTMKDFAFEALLIDSADPLIQSVKPEIVALASLFTGDNKISKNLLEYYKEEALNETSIFDLSTFEVDELHLYYTKIPIPLNDHDVLVPFDDMNVIYESATLVDEKVMNEIKYKQHSSIKDSKNLTISIREVLK